MGVLENTSAREPVETIDNATVYLFASSSSPGQHHVTFVTQDNDIRCTCLGFQNAGHCWHWTWAWEHIDE